MKRLLIIGGSGFLGGHLLYQAKRSYHVTATYFQHKYEIEDINWIKFDLSSTENFEKLLEIAQPDIIIQAAAISSVDECEIQKDAAFSINVKANKELAQLANKYRYRFIFVSSDMVYDGSQGNYSENDTVNPINYYGLTKIWAEQEIKNSCGNYVIGRAALIYGKPITNMNSFSEQIHRMTSMNQQVRLFTDQYRTPVLVDNLAESLLELGEHSFVGTINLGGSQRINRYQFGMEMAKIYQFSSELLIPTSMFSFETKARRPQDVSLDISLAKSFLKTKSIDINEGLRLSRSRNYHL